ncbi:MAG: ribonuclease III [Anaerolineae bacterium]
MLDGLAAMESRLGYTFRDQGLLRTALTHSSFLNESPEPTEDNERLEYLGDAVLDFVVAEMLYRGFPQAQEGDLTRWRAQLVSTEALAALALDLGIGEALLIGKGEEGTGGQHRPANLAAAFEAIVAAIYLDSGLEELCRVIPPIFAQATRRVTMASGPADARSRLQELAQARYGITPRYRTVEEHGPDHARVFTVQVYIGDQLYGEGQGRSKRSAAQAAADEALGRLAMTAQA